MPDLEPIPYSDAKIRAILERVRTIALVGASANWNRPSYFVMKYLQGKGYRVIPVNPGIAGKTLLGETVYASLKRHPRSCRHDRPLPQFRRGAWRRRRRDRHRRQGRVDAARRAQRRGGEDGGGGGPRSDHEPLPEDRVRAARRRIVVERGQQRHHPEPPARGAVAAPGQELARRLRPISLTASRPAPSMPAPRPIRPPARARPRSTRRRLMCSTTSTTRPRSSTCTISATSIPGSPTRPSRCWRSAIAALEGGRAAVAASSGHAAQFLTFFTLMEPGDEFVASRNLYGGSLTQFGLSFKKLGWTCHFVDPTEPENFRRALNAEMQGDLHREPRQSGRRRGRHRGRGEGRARGGPAADRRQHARDPLPLPADRARRRHRRPFDHQVPGAATAMRSAAWWSNRASSTGRKAAAFPR